MKTTLEIDQRYIQEKLFSRIRIAVERADTVATSDENLFETFKTTGSLSILKIVSGKVRRYIQSNSGSALDGYPDMKSQIDKIEALVRNHAKDLSSTAADQNANVQALSDRDFDHLAKEFEGNHSRSLRIKSAPTWT